MQIPPMQAGFVLAMTGLGGLGRAYGVMMLPALGVVPLLAALLAGRRFLVRGIAGGVVIALAALAGAEMAEVGPFSLGRLVLYLSAAASLLLTGGIVVASYREGIDSFYYCMIGALGLRTGVYEQVAARATLPRIVLFVMVAVLLATQQWTFMFSFLAFPLLLLVDPMGLGALVAGFGIEVLGRTILWFLPLPVVWVACRAIRAKIGLGPLAGSLGLAAVPAMLGPVVISVVFMLLVTGEAYPTRLTYEQARYFFVPQYATYAWLFATLFVALRAVVGGGRVRAGALAATALAVLFLAAVPIARLQRLALPEGWR